MLGWTSAAPKSSDERLGAHHSRPCCQTGKPRAGAAVESGILLEAIMPLPITPLLLDRRAVVSAVAAMAVTLVRSPVSLARAAPLLPTPGQTAGPFYPVDWSGDVDADLVRVMGEAAQAQGVVTHLHGRVLDRQSAPISGAVVEIWQCDAFGHYRHPRDRQDGRDLAFQGRGVYHHRVGRELCFSDHPSGAVSWAHSAHPCGGSRARAGAASHAVLRVGRAVERERWAVQQLAGSAATRGGAAAPGACGPDRDRGPACKP